MKIRSIISPLAVMAALSISSGAMAQTMSIPVDDLPQVHNLCRSLAAQANESLSSAGDLEDDTTDTTDTTDTSDPAAGEPSDLDQALTRVDLETITFEDCKNWGFVDSNEVVVQQ